MSDSGFGWFSRKRANSTANKAAGKKPRARRSGIIALEPRMMYDGAAAATAGAAASHHHHHDVGADHGQPPSGEKHLEQMPNVQTAASAPSSSTASGGGNTNTHVSADAGKSWQHQASEPMPHVVKHVKDPTEIVFIDAAVPDAEVLAQGAKAGVEVVMLDANSDGVQQIANFLARHPDPNLTTIDIVAHGADGIVQLGNTLLSSSTIGYYQSQLAAIGHAMQAGGTIQIFGCDVAQDITGDLFLVQLAEATGGKNIDASSSLVGAAALGGSWTLNVEVNGGTGGSPDAANPFTDATLAAYNEVLPDEIFLTSAGNLGDMPSAADFRVQLLNAGTGAVSTIISDSTVPTQANPTPLLTPAYIAVDAAHGVYYLTNQNGNGFGGYTGNQLIEIGKIDGSAFTDGNKLDTIFAGPNNANTLFTGLAFDPQHNVLYFGQAGTVEVLNTPTAADAGTGIFRLNVGSLNLNSPGLLSETQVVTSPGFVTPTALALDVPDQIIYFTDVSGSFTLGALNGGHSTNAIWEAKLPAPNSGAQTVANAVMIYQLDSGASVVTGYDQGMLSGLALDQADGKLFFSTTSPVGMAGAFTASLNQVFSANVPEVGGVPTVPAANGSSLTGITTLYSGTTSSLLNTGFASLNIGLDVNSGVAGGELYLNLDKGNSSSLVDGATATGGTLSTLFTPTFSGGAGSTQINLAVDAPAVVTAAGTTISYPTGNSAIIIDAGLNVTTPSAADELLTSATVSIGTGFQANQDNLNFINQNGITGSYDATSGQLKLSGVATAATYAAALDSVTFNTNSSTGGQRTINFTVTDGVVTSNTGADFVNVLEAPTLKATGTNPTFFESLTTPTAVTLFSGATATVPSGDSITALQLTVSGLSAGDNEELMIDGTPVALTNGNAVTAHGDHVLVSVASGVATVTITDPGTNFTTATAQMLVNGLQYEDASSPLTTGTRTVTLTSIQDNDSRGAPTSATASGTSTVTVNAVNHPPSVTANADNPTFSEGGSAVTLFGSAVVSTNDNGQAIEQLQLTVSNLADGANEKLSIDGSLVSLTNSTAVTTVDNDHVTVSNVSGTTATVTITNPSNLTNVAAETLIDGLAYQDTSATLTVGTRTVTLTKVEDTGGTANGGKDTTTLAIASVVTLANGPVIAPASKSETGSVTEIAGVTGSSTPDTASGTINFTDTVLTDVNTSSASLVTAVSSGNAIPAATMTALGSALTTVLAESNGSGTVNWTFSLADSNLDFLGASQTLTATYHVTISNGNGGTDTATVTITATGTNDAAIISGVTSGDVTEAGGVNNAILNTPTTSGTLTDTDVDNPANTFQSVTLAASDNNFGSYSMTAAGTWSYSLNNANSMVQALNVGQTLTDTFTVDTVDGTAQQIIITIHGANDAATISGVTSGDVTEAGGVNNAILNTPTTSGTLTDIDVDNPNNLFTAVNASTPSDNQFGSFTMTSGGTWTYTVDNSNATVQALNVGQTLTDTFTVDTVDGTAQQITVTIHGANDAAVVGGTDTGTVVEAGGVGNNIPNTPAVSGTLTDTDVDNPANTFTPVLASTPGDHGFGDFTMTASGAWTYTLDNNNAQVQALNVGQTLTDTFTVATVDGTTHQVTVTIDGANDAATISGVTSGDVTEAGGVNNAILNTPTTSGTLTDIDVDNPNNLFTAVNASATSDNQFGSYTMTSGGTWTYTVDNSNATVQALNVGQTLTDTFTVDTVDGTAQQITVTIHGANDAAVVGGTDTRTVVEAGGVSNAILNTPSTSGTLTDTDVDNPANTFTAVNASTPSDHGFGDFTMTASGTWTYTLDNNNAQVQALNVGQTLTDTFTVATVDGTTHQVTVTIDGANDAATISGVTSGDVTEAGGVNNAILNTPTTSGTLTDIDVDNPNNLFTAVNASAPSDNQFGSYTMTTGGTWTYTVDNSNATVQTLNVGQTLTDTFTVDTVDGTAQQITVTIHGANDAAVVGGTDTGTVVEAGGVSNAILNTPSTSGTLTDTDVDNPANTFTAVNASTPSDHGFGDFTMTASGTWTFTLDNNNAQVQALNVGQTLTDTFTVATVDGTTHQVTVTIDGANDAAVVSGITTGDVTEAGGVNNNIPGIPTTSGLLTDTDIDNPANTFTAVTTATASDHGYGSFTMTTGGTWSYTLDNSNAQVQALNVGQTLTDTFSVDTIDGTAQQITVTIHGANDAAVVGGTDTGTVVEAGGVSNAILNTPVTSGTLTDTDVDNPANTFAAVNASTPSDHGFGDFTMTSNGTWTFTLDNNNAQVQALNVGQTLTDTFTVATIDGTTHQVTVTIDGANDAAVVSGVATGDVTEAGGVNNNIPGIPTTSGLLTDTDIDNPANTFTAVSTSTPSDHYGNFTMTSGGTWTYTVDNSNGAVQALNVGQTLTDTFTVSSIDGTAQQIDVTIHGANDAAVVSGVTTGDVTEAGGVNNAILNTPTASGLLTDTDVDNPANTFTAVSAPTASDHGFGSFTMTAGGTWTYTVDNSNATVQALNVGQTLTDTFTVDTVDGTAQQVTITIHGANDAAVVAGVTTGTVVEAGGVDNAVPGTPTTSGLVTDTDIDNPANAFTAVTTVTASDHAFGSFTMTAAGSWTYTVDNNNAAVQALNFGQTLTDTFTVHTVDGTAQQISITIDGTNDSPVLTAGNTQNFDANVGQSVLLDAAITVHDVDNTTLAGAQVAITGGFDAGHDSLGFINQHGISGSYNSATGVLTLTGTASIADYQAALASISFNSTSQTNDVRTVQWTVDDGSAQFHRSLPDTTKISENGILSPPHLPVAAAQIDTQPNTTPGVPVFDNGPTFQTASFTNDGTGGNGAGFSFNVVHTDPSLITADANVQINVALAALEAPLGGDVVAVEARQADGKPLPDWLKFDPATGTFAGTPPDNAVASLAPDQSSDNNIVTGTLRQDFDGGGRHEQGSSSITVEVLARDSKGNLAVTVFTIDLHQNGQHGWNMQPFGVERHAALVPLSPELAAIEAAVRDTTRAIEPLGLHGMRLGHGDAISVGGYAAVPAGRAGLTEQMAQVGWRSMAAQRNALLASLQQGR